MGYDQANPFGDSNTSPYDAIRNRIKKDSGNLQAQGNDAITRRFAAMGGLNSGSYVQAMNDNARNATQGAQDALSNVDMQEQGQALPFSQLKQQNQQFEKGLAEQKSEFGQELPLKSRALDLEAQQLGMENAANMWNQYLGQEQLNRSGGLFGGGGFLGTGVSLPRF